MKKAKQLILIWGRLLLLLLFSAIVFLVIATFSYNKLFEGRIYHGVYFSNLSLSGLTPKQAEKKIDEKTRTFSKAKLVFYTEELSYPLLLSDINLAFEPKLIAQASYQIGRNDDLISNFLIQFKSFFQKEKVDPRFEIAGEELEKEIKNIAATLDKPKVETRIEIENDQAKIIPGKEGKIVDQKNLERKALEAVFNQSLKPIKIEIVSDKPRIDAQEAHLLFPKIETAVAKEITLAFGYKSWQLNKTKIADLLSFSTKSQEDLWTKISLSGQTFTFGPVSNIYAKEEETNSNLIINQEKLDGFVDEIAIAIDRRVQNANFSLENGRVIILSTGVDGRLLNRKETKEKIERSLFAESEEKPARINLPVETTKAQVIAQNLEGYGIKELIGRGWSNFSGSASGRIYNIGLASSRMDGTLISPGETFSFNQAVGEITKETGYKTAYIIERGRTIFGTGGGVCQVSTTTFRAALNSGLPIVKRHPHAYRVAYYEQAGFSAGLDATIFQPTVDLQFKNDTPAYILIHAWVDKAAQNLYFDFYGTSDGRIAEVSKPVVTNHVAPPEPLYEDDPTLPSGVVKQADFPSWGADAIVKRIVKRGGEILQDDIFKSHYKAWRAVYKVGTG